jgi:hypothetical protein
VLNLPVTCWAVHRCSDCLPAGRQAWRLGGPAAAPAHSPRLRVCSSAISGATLNLTMPGALLVRIRDRPGGLHDTGVRVDASPSAQLLEGCSSRTRPCTMS